MVMRKSASASSEVIGQITTEAWLSGIAFDCTMTAGRGFPQSPGPATITRSPRLIGIELGDGLDPAECVAFAVRVQPCHLCRDSVAYGFRARIRHNETQFAQALPPAPCPHHPHSFGGFGHLSSVIA